MNKLIEYLDFIPAHHFYIKNDRTVSFKYGDSKPYHIRATIPRLGEYVLSVSDYDDVEVAECKCINEDSIINLVKVFLCWIDQ